MKNLSSAKIAEQIRKLGFHPIENGDYGAVILVSAENGDDAADYYGEFRGGYPWIHPKLEKFATSKGCFWEWINPGLIGLYN